MAIRPDAGEADVRLEKRLADAVRRGRAHHPHLVVDPVAFVEFAAIRGPIEKLATYLGDLYLACAATHRVPGALERIEELCISQVPRALARIDRTPTFVAEIQQRVREKLVLGTAEQGPRIAEYGARGSLVGFVRITAVREALLEKRAAGRRRVEPCTEAHAIDHGDLAIELVRRAYHADLQSALDEALASLDPRERAALRLSYLEDLSIDAIGRLFGVHRATAARWILRALERVREVTRATMQRRLGLTASEADSLVADLTSMVSLSPAALAAPAAQTAA